MSFQKYNFQTSANRIEYNQYNSTNVMIHNLMNHNEPDLAVVPNIPCIHNNEDYFNYQVKTEVYNITAPHSQVSSYYQNYQHQVDYTYVPEKQLKNTFHEKSRQKNKSKTCDLSRNSKLIKSSKPKRHRTTFKFEQLEALENYYKHKQYVTSQDRKYLQELLQIKDNTIKVWFQNRRLKDRKHNNKQSLQTSTNEVSNGSMSNQFIEQVDIKTEIDRLTEEFKHKQEKDELDDFLLSLIKPTHYESNIKMELSTEATQVQNLFYEPISPADSNEGNEETKSSLFETKELLKTFLNFQDV